MCVCLSAPERLLESAFVANNKPSGKQLSAGSWQCVCEQPKKKQEPVQNRLTPTEINCQPMQAGRQAGLGLSISVSNPITRLQANAETVTTRTPGEDLVGKSPKYIKSSCIKQSSLNRGRMSRKTISDVA